ncbi:hypothetical protein B0H17DRAFT_1146367 [Mycena rosella]|uniref:Uncharacterized protein n=1 Tax=Mycena rosella TaxID=1033263 RepID=A0AAD7G3J8_MYCRO|nr:hypothetical protein B0H17DRAFT_1146367 [Mycena rosella]
MAPRDRGSSASGWRHPRCIASTPRSGYQRYRQSLDLGEDFHRFFRPPQASGISPESLTTSQYPSDPLSRSRQRSTLNNFFLTGDTPIFQPDVKDSPILGYRLPHQTPFLGSHSRRYFASVDRRPSRNVQSLGKKFSRILANFCWGLLWSSVPQELMSYTLLRAQSAMAAQ